MIPDFAYCPNYCFVLFEYFPLFLHFLTSLIKLILWLKFFHRQKAGRGHGGQGPQGPAVFHLVNSISVTQEFVNMQIVRPHPQAY